MASYRAKSMGQHPDRSGKRLRAGDVIEWDFGDQGAPKWLEVVDASSAPAPAAAPAPETQAPPTDEPESASAPPAASKRNLRKRSVAPKETE
jgi:hypothetical protein